MQREQPGAWLARAFSVTCDLSQQPGTAAGGTAHGASSLSVQNSADRGITA